MFFTVFYFSEPRTYLPAVVRNRLWCCLSFVAKIEPRLLNKTACYSNGFNLALFNIDIIFNSRTELYKQTPLPHRVSGVLQTPWGFQVIRVFPWIYRMLEHDRRLLGACSDQEPLTRRRQGSIRVLSATLPLQHSSSLLKASVCLIWAAISPCCTGMLLFW